MSRLARTGDDEGYLDTPNFPECLHRIEPAGEDVVAWRSPAFGAVLAA